MPICHAGRNCFGLPKRMGFSINFWVAMASNNEAAITKVVLVMLPSSGNRYVPNTSAGQCHKYQE